MIDEMPNYYGILPAHIRYSKALKPMEKIFYTELTALTNKHGYCSAKNSYFAELYEVHKKTVSSWISNLKNNGFIDVEIIYEENTKEIIERRIYITNEADGYAPKDGEGTVERWRDYPDKDGEAIREKITTPIHEKTDYNNTRDKYYKKNNTRVNNISKEKKEKKEKNSFEAFSLPFWIDEQIWQEFLEMRQKIKKPPTLRAKQLLVKKLERFGINSANEILEQSIINCWQDVYELKNKSSPSSNPHNFSKNSLATQQQMLAVGKMLAEREGA